MRMEFFILTQIVSGFMGFLLGKAVKEHNGGDDRYVRRYSKTELRPNSDMRGVLPNGVRDRSGDNSESVRMDAEEVINGLQDLRMSLSSQEKNYLDYACDCVYKVDVLTKMVEEFEANKSDEV